MKKKPQFKIVIVDDDDFYNKLLTKHIDNELSKLSIIHGFGYEIKSFTSCKDCTLNYDNDTSLIFTDYYLGNGYNASYLLEFIKRRSAKCKVVVISQVESVQTALSTLLSGAYDFFRKDANLFLKCRDLAATVITDNLAHKN